MTESTNTATDTAAEIERLAAAARDSLTDEMVARLAGAGTDAIDLIDRVNRSGLAEAIPALADLVKNGDLERVTRLARVYGSAEDALTDEMVGRLSETAAEGISLLDRVNRSGLEQALPAISRLVADGDLDRLVQLARVYGSAQDALTDEMVSRLAETMAEGLSLLDRLNRGGAGRLIEMLARLEASGALERIAESLPRLLDRMDMLEGMLGAFETAATDTARQPRSSGGAGGLWALMRDPENQDSLRFLINLGKELRRPAKR
ncbi:MAG: hypothetical protein R3E87_11590 [Burkholderiaceae bacterium]